jgi:orotidine-5'-phosphate decarboxylase
LIDANKIIVALDFHEKEKVIETFHQLQGHPIWIKIGLELFYSLGPQAVYLAKERGFNVFLDLKLHDIPNTVFKALQSLKSLPIDMINVHALGGLEMMKRAADAILEYDRKPLLIAVTQLTSTSPSQFNNELKFNGDILDHVSHLAFLAKSAGLGGVVASPLEVEIIKKLCGKDFKTITPGIRPHGSESDDQKRITTPQEALTLGSDFLVIGRPITRAPNLRQALEEILNGE